MTEKVIIVRSKLEHLEKVEECYNKNSAIVHIEDGTYVTFPYNDVDTFRKYVDECKWSISKSVEARLREKLHYEKEDFTTAKANFKNLTFEMRKLKRDHAKEIAKMESSHHKAKRSTIFLWCALTALLIQSLNYLIN